MTIKQIFHHLNRRSTHLLPKSKLFKIIIISSIVSISFLCAKNILAQTDNYIPNQTVQEYNDKRAAFGEGKMDNENFLKQAFISHTMIGVEALIGDYPIATNSATTWVPGGLMGAATKTIAMTYDIPISGVQYIAQVKDSFLGKPTYAVTGFQSMSPLIPIWKGFRNATYVLFSIVFMVMGLMIMLRIKISPQATVTIQSTIPKIITSLILVTFSYAIVGLLIDFSYLIANLGISMIYQATGDTSVITNSTNDFWFRVWAISSPANGFTLINGLIGTILNGIDGAIIGFIVGLLGFVVGLLIITIIVVINVFKFMFGLIKCYISIILKTIIGPLEIALGAIPNIKIGFGTWFTDIFANLMVFPITSIVLVLIKKIMDAVWNSNGMWVPPGLDGNISATSTNQFISLAIGFGGLLLLAKLPSLIPEFIFQIKPSPFGKAIGEGFAPLGKTASGMTKIGAKAGLQATDAAFGSDNGSRWWNQAITGINKVVNSK